MQGLLREALDLQGQRSPEWELGGGGESGKWLTCLQLATPGNPQAKVNPALAETRTPSNQKREVRGRETQPVASRAWDVR